MNCELIKEKIDYLVFGKNETLYKDITDHIKSCDSCNSYFTESMAAKNIIGVLQKDPKLHDPDTLFNNIMATINEEEKLTKSNIEGSNGKVIQLIRRSLAAASVLFILIFGVEQFAVVNKISKLENYTSNIQTDKGNISFKSMVNYNTGLLFEVNNIKTIEEFIKPADRNIRTRILIARLATLPIRQFDNKRANKIMQSITIVKTH